MRWHFSEWLPNLHDPFRHVYTTAGISDRGVCSVLSRIFGGFPTMLLRSVRFGHLHPLWHQGSVHPYLTISRNLLTQTPITSLILENTFQHGVTHRSLSFPSVEPSPVVPFGCYIVLNGVRSENRRNKQKDHRPPAEPWLGMRASGFPPG